MKYIIRKIDIVFLISLVLAIISCFIVPIDKGYIKYFDFKTLATLFLMMVIIGGYKDIKVFHIISNHLVRQLKNTRSIIMFLVISTFIGDMILANDMSLITFIPLTFAVFSNKKAHEKLIVFTVVMQVIAADLGGMITPFGNPQNLYVYSHYNLSATTFFNIMIIPFAISLILLCVILLLVPKREMLLEKPERKHIDKKHTIIYSIMFIIVVLMVLRFIPFWIFAAIIILFMLVIDYKSFLRVDYILLLTFSALFIFTGNVSRMINLSQAVNTFFANHEFETSIVICQFLSNVPTTILLSHFTQNYKSLLIGVNIGSLGTLVASMASLIAYRQFAKEFPHKAREYLVVFTGLNILFLVVLYISVKILNIS